MYSNTFARHLKTILGDASEFFMKIPMVVPLLMQAGTGVFGYLALVTGTQPVSTVPA